MMTNLFNVFDPSTDILQLNLNWVSTLLALLILASPYWLLPSSPLMLTMEIKKTLNKELATLLGPSNFNEATWILMTLFTFILINNTMGLFPYIFTATSHLVMKISLALPFWFTAILYGWINNTYHMLAHLVPQSTPLSTHIFYSLHWNY